MSKHLFAAIVYVAILGIIVWLINGDHVSFDNRLEKEMLITREYTNSQIIEMIDRINRKDLKMNMKSSA